MGERRLDFVDHRRELGENRYVYPVISRRSRGLSVGVNLNPDKACNFDCPYCQVDRTVAPRWRSVDAAVLEAELDALLALAAGGDLWSIPPFDTAAPALRRVNDVAFAGDGEPTAFKGFGEAVELVGRLLARHGLAEVKPIVLTNATLFHRPAVSDALQRLHDLGGEIWAKLDAGTEAYFQRVDGTRLPFGRVLRNLGDAARRWPLVIQAMFHAFDGVPPSEAELDAWAGRLADILAGGGRLKLVQVYTVARAPAEPSVGALERAALEAAAARVERLGVPVEVFPAR